MAFSPGEGIKRDLRQLCGRGRWILPLIAVALFLLSVPLTHAQTTAQLTGTVQDPSGAVIPGATVTLTDQVDRYLARRANESPGIVCLSLAGTGHLHRKVTAKSFQPKEITGIMLHAGDVRRRPGDYADRGRSGCDGHGRSIQRNDSRRRTERASMS